MNGKELMAQQNNFNWRDLKEQATMLVRSGFLPVAINTPEKAIAVAIAGKELGIGMMESFRSINVVQGKPTISPQLMLALAYKTKELENIEMNVGKEKAIVTIKRKGHTPHTEEFGVKEATDMKLIGKDNYQKQASTMFKWRALAACLRVTFPDVVLGLYTPDEMGMDVKVDDETMEVVNHQNEPPKQNYEYAEDAAETMPQKESLPPPKKTTAPIKTYKISTVPMAVIKKESKKTPGRYYYEVQDWQGNPYLTFSETTADRCREAEKDNRLMEIVYEDKVKFKRIVEVKDQHVDQ